MPDKPDLKVPDSAVPRLAQYHHALMEMAEGVASSDDLARVTGFSAAQIRKDLTYFGQFGRPGFGYSVPDLKQALSRILGTDKAWSVAVVGTGKALSVFGDLDRFRRHGFRVTACFEKEPDKNGAWDDVPVYPMDKLGDVVRRENIRMAVLAVSEGAAQRTAEILAESGVQAILNLTPARLQLPERVAVRPMDLAMELEKLSYRSGRLGDR
ncbi:MAG TPA: redox-sensing transcriptional repressor Rex [Elusimicrobiota bacterium]|nr:redox-sensing transcriptional repressor Rex [Elusimicrobiota bacterium]